MSEREDRFDSGKTQGPDSVTESASQISMVSDGPKKEFRLRNLSGEKLGRYILIELIGEGGMGFVYKAFDPVLDRLVAVKILNIASISNVRKARTRLIREAQALAHLSHPNVVAAYDVGVAEDSVFVVMEYVEGQTFRQWMTEKKRSREEILSIFIAAGKGLKAAHDAGLVHRDFKPANVMVGKDGRVRVLDFGLTRAFGSFDDSISGDSNYRDSNSCDSISGDSLFSKLSDGDDNCNEGFYPETREFNGNGLEQKEQLMENRVAVQAEKSSVPPQEHKFEDSSDAQLQDEEPELQDLETLDLYDMSQSRKFLSSDLTRIGEIIGTPAYMAPEQFLNLEVGDYTDQFSFCAAMYEAMYGLRPFSANRMDLFRENIESEKVRPPPLDKDVPEWLSTLILKGLNPRPEDRHESMGVLIDILQNDPDKVRAHRRSVRRRQIMIVLLVLLSVLGPLGYWYFQRVRTAENCKNVSEKLRGVWDEQVKKNVEQAFAKTGVFYASDTAMRVSKNLDKYVQDWTRLRGEICEARWLEGTESDQSFHQKMNCFALRYRELDSLVKAFTKADSNLIPRAVQASLSLSRLDTCLDEAALRDTLPLPGDLGTRAKIRDLRLQLADLKTMDATGKYKAGVELAKKLVHQADKLGYLPLQAEATYSLGKALFHVRDDSESVKVLWKAAKIASRSKYPKYVAWSYSLLSFVVGYQQQKTKEGLLIARDAEIMLHLADARDKDWAPFLNNKGLVLSSAGYYKEAKDAFEQAIVLDKKAYGPLNPSLGLDLENLGLLLGDLGEDEKAEEYIERSLDIFKKSLGATHPETAYAYGNLGMVEASFEHYKKAKKYFIKALEILKTTYGGDNLDLAWCYSNLATACLNEDELQQARKHFMKSIEILKKNSESEHTDMADAYQGLGELERKEGNFKRAMDYFDKALAINTKVNGKDHVRIASVLEDLGRLQIEMADYTEAKKNLEHALSIRKRVKEQAKNRLVPAIFELGKLYVVQKKFSLARGQFEKVLSICANSPCSAEALHGSEFAMAKILAASGEKAAARKFAYKAQAGFRKKSRRFKKQLQQIRILLEGLP